MSQDPDILVKVENVSKKFCRSLKKSLWYGVQDIVSDLNPFHDTGSSNPGQSDAFRALKEGGRALASSRLRPDEFWAVDDVSFELRRGECLGLIGHNGAGKTTLLKMLNGLLKPDRGRMEMRGRVGALIALGAGFNPILTGRENIYVNGAVLGLKKKEIHSKLDEIIDFADLREFIDAPVQGYSSGMAVRLGFAIAAKCNPDILLLDEVLAVGDVGFQAKCFNTLSEFRKNGTAFILVSHNMHQVSRYCDQVLYLKRGRIAQLGEVGAGIDRFLREMHSQEEGGDSEVTDWSKVYGSGKVVLKSATFISKSGELIKSIRPGDTFCLAIDYECPDESIDDAVLDLVIRDRDGMLFQATSKSYGVDFGRLASRGRFLITIENMPANTPQVQFSFALVSGGSREMYDWKRHLKLKIESDPMMNGRIALNVHWVSIPACKEACAL